MKQFIKNNPTIVFGLGLPLLMIAIISIIAVIPSLGVEKPKYNLLYTVGYNNFGHYQGVHIEVENKKSRIFFVGENKYYSAPKLFIFNPSKNSTREIEIKPPSDLRDVVNDSNSKKITPIIVPELENLILDNSDTAPDGYKFLSHDDYNNSFLLTDIFVGNRSNRGAVLQKDSYKIRIPNTPNNYYDDVKLIGWVISQ